MIYNMTFKYCSSFIVGVIIGAITCSILLKDIDPRDKLLLAISKGDIDEIKELEKQHEEILDSWIFYADDPGSGYFPIQYALYLNQISIVFYMLERGVNTNRITDNGTPLDIAMGRYNYPMITKLIEKGADVNYGLESLLSIAIAEYLHLQMKIDIILENGAAFLNEDEKKQSNYGL